MRRTLAIVGAEYLLLVALFCFAPTISLADSAVTWGYELSHDVMSPFCPGRTLAACPSPQADELRMWIITQEAAGATRAEVESMLIERYGEDIFAAPPVAGAVGVSAYGVPVAGFALGIGVVLLALRRISGARPEPSDVARAASSEAPSDSVGSEADADLERQIDEDLRA